MSEPDEDAKRACEAVSYFARAIPQNAGPDVERQIALGGVVSTSISLIQIHQELCVIRFLVFVIASLALVSTLKSLGFI